MKRFIALVLVFAVFCTIPLTVSAADVSNYAANIDNDVPAVAESAARIGHWYKKTVVNYYSSFSDIPEVINYKEYNSELKAWFSGALYLQSAVRDSSTSWKATFSGYLTGTI